MLSRLFAPSQLIDNDALAFMQAVQRWALDAFGRDYFDRQIQLVLPTNDYFPDPLGNVDEMATRTLERMLGYTGLSHWPAAVSANNDQPLQIPAQLTGPAAGTAQLPIASEPVTLRYNPLQASDPQAMIASHAQQLGACLVAVTAQPPPADASQLPLVAELLAVHLGFGIQLANSAFVFAGGCGGCRRSAAGRVAYLNQDEALMALALFCRQKGIATNAVSPYLHKHLRGVYKQAVRQLNRAPAT